jgi:hypothetical protein
VNKHSLWQQALEDVDKITDRLGKGIDPGIRETVAILQLLGLHTRASCEGHLHWGEPAPWVDFESPEVRTLRHQRDHLCERLDQLPEGDPACQQLEERVKKLSQEMRKHDAWEIKKLIPSLDAFYRERRVAYDVRLIINHHNRLINQGVYLQPGEGSTRQTAKLRAYQEEMTAFTAFLKQQFFGVKGNRPTHA